MANTSDGGRVAPQGWGAVAAGWDKISQMPDEVWALNHWLTEKLDAQPGQTILDLAAGPGIQGFDVAERIGDAGTLISTDLSPEMLEIGKRRAAERGLTNVKFQVVDAENIELPDSSVDGIICKFGLMLTPEPHRAVVEMRRVLRPGGRAVIATQGAPEKNPALAASGMALVMSGHELSGPGPMEPGGVFSLSSPDALRQLLESGGFEHVDVELVEAEWEFASFDDYWILPSQISARIAVFVQTLSAEEVAKVKDALRQIIEPYRKGGGYVFPRSSVAAVAS